MNFYLHFLFVDVSYEVDQKLPGTRTFPVPAFLCSANIAITTDSYAGIVLWKHH